MNVTLRRKEEKARESPKHAINGDAKQILATPARGVFAAIATSEVGDAKCVAHADNEENEQ
jgi:hypothetical protein